MTDSMRRAIDETERRRAIQLAYNQEHGITPQSIISKIDMELAGIVNADYVDVTQEAEEVEGFTSQEQLDDYIARLEADMREAAKRFEFEKAAQLRDRVRELKTKEFIFTGTEIAAEPTAN
jgi:excinuclease ABC subunit B